MVVESFKTYRDSDLGDFRGFEMLLKTFRANVAALYVLHPGRKFLWLVTVSVVCVLSISTRRRMRGMRPLLLKVVAKDVAKKALKAVQLAFL